MALPKSPSVTPSTVAEGGPSQPPRRRRARAGTAVLTGSVLVAGSLVAIQAPAAAGSVTTVRVSVSSRGAQGIGTSGSAARNQTVSANGQVVAFYSDADNLVRGDTNGDADIVVRDLSSGRTSLASLSSTGTAANDFSIGPSLDSTGRRVAFLSYASNLVPGDTNDTADVFVRDRQAATTTRVSVSSSGKQSSGLSEDAVISANGRVVAFVSNGGDLVPPTGGIGGSQVYVHDLTSGRTRLVSAAPGGAPGSGDSNRPSLSADGTKVAFQSTADDLVPDDTNGTCDGNGCPTDVFVRDVLAGSTVRASVRPDETQGISGSDPSISADGTRLVLLGKGLVPGDGTPGSDVYLRDLAAGTTSLVSRSAAGAQARSVGAPELSGNGRTVVFSSMDALVAGDTNGEEDVFVRDLPARTTRRASVSATGAQGDSFSIDPDVSGDGRRVVFLSYATNLVPGDTNGMLDVFSRSF